MNVGNKIRHSTFKNIRPHGQEGVSGDGSNAQAIYLVRILPFAMNVPSKASRIVFRIASPL